MNSVKRDFEEGFTIGQKGQCIACPAHCKSCDKAESVCDPGGCRPGYGPGNKRLALKTLRASKLGAGASGTRKSLARPVEY